MDLSFLARRFTSMGSTSWRQHAHQSNPPEGWSGAPHQNHHYIKLYSYKGTFPSLIHIHHHHHRHCKMTILRHTVDDFIFHLNLNLITRRRAVKEVASLHAIPLRHNYLFLHTPYDTCDYFWHPLAMLSTVSRISALLCTFLVSIPPPINHQPD